ncbi:MAG: hypothetical protein M1832_006062 [Thelocarpon impressellum]|nr:MAG: hypothetical protein M1832_006062 [Thelocarpon impressellum]
MSRSTDPGHFFQTSASISESARRAAKASNSLGAPIRLGSKLLAILPCPESAGAIFVAESAGVARRLVLDTGVSSTTYRGPAAPLTSLALALHAGLLVAGCWDKRVWSWDVATGERRRVFTGQGDFVKAVLCVHVAGRDLLVSGGADAAILVWDLVSGERLHTLRGHARGVQDLALDPLDSSPDGAVVFSAGSEREVRRWRVSAASAAEVEESTPIVAHETSVYRMRFDAEAGELWTASADRTARCLARDEGWAAETTLAHPDFVRDIVLAEEAGFVVTACRDEEVRVWDRSVRFRILSRVYQLTGEQTGKLLHSYAGHYEEVTGLALLSARCVASISIDGTVRRWELTEVAFAAARTAAEEQGTGKAEPPAASAEGLTAEEEDELAALMDE